MANAFEMPWVDLIKPNMEEIKPAQLVLSQTPEDLHKNHNGDMHAAVIFSMLEMAGMGVITLFLGDAIKDSLVVLKDMHIHYDARAQGKIFFKASLDEGLQEKLKRAIDKGDNIEEQVYAVAYDENNRQVAHASMSAVIKSK
ncbi:MAG: YiiD C-terminal domain-containing protein [Pseudomonadales bacterium]|nr:YiiD C-terminal domain-containing protein [Pseudomonadales bacterium]